jgi:hypothetical protein
MDGKKLWNKQQMKIMILMLMQAAQKQLNSHQSHSLVKICKIGQ